MRDPSAYHERTSSVTGITVWTRVSDGSSSLILPDGCIDVLWNGRELTARPLLADVIGKDETERLAESLLATDDPSSELERWAGHRLARAGGRDRLMCHVAALIDVGRTVSEVAEHVGLSERQLGRRALAAFGYGPKVLARVLRLQRALGLARGGMSLIQAALAAGYGDQAHFAREVRALTGQTASQLVGSAANRSTPLPSGSRKVA